MTDGKEHYLTPPAPPSSRAGSQPSASVSGQPAGQQHGRDNNRKGDRRAIPHKRGPTAAAPPVPIPVDARQTPLKKAKSDVQEGIKHLGSLAHVIDLHSQSIKDLTSGLASKELDQSTIVLLHDVFDVLCAALTDHPKSVHESFYKTLQLCLRNLVTTADPRIIEVIWGTDSFSATGIKISFPGLCPLVFPVVRFDDELDATFLCNSCGNNPHEDRLEEEPDA
jgi:hypothetical protein